MSWKCKVRCHDWAFSFHPIYIGNKIPDLRSKNRDEILEYSNELRQIAKIKKPVGFMPMRICRQCGKVDMKIMLEICRAMYHSSEGTRK